MSGFGDKLMGLLSDPRTMDIGMGLLSAGGPSFTPHNMGQDMASAYQYANGREGERNQLEMQRAKLTQQKQLMAQQQKQAQARKQYQGLLSHPAASVPAAIRRPGAVANEPAQMQGLLAQAYPEQYGAAQVAGLFAPQKSQLSSGPRDFALMSGMNPTDPEFMAAYQQYQVDSDPSAAAEASSRALNDALVRATLEDRRAESARTQREQETIERTRVTGRNSSLREVDSLIGLLEQAEGTGAQPGKMAETIGNAASITAGFQRWAGLDSSRAEEIATLQGKIAKGFSRLNGTTIPDAYLGSNAKLNFFSDGLGGRDQESGVNFSILKALVEDLRDADYNDDGEIKDEAKYNALIQRIDRIMGVVDYEDLP